MWDGDPRLNDNRYIAKFIATFQKKNTINLFRQIDDQNRIIRDEYVNVRCFC